MATEPKTTEQVESSTMASDKVEETSATAKYEQLLEQLPTLFEKLMPQEESAEPPLFQSFDLASAAKYMLNCANIIVMSGAGISTSAGIPDFRSPGTGLYSKLEKYNLPFPEAIFELNYFRENPQAFFLLAKELYPNNFKPTPTHYFIRLLQEKGKLLRTFTQNIDSLERIAGIPLEKIIEAHGSFFTAHCLDCREEFSLEYVKDVIFQDKIPHCNKCNGIVKPDIVFFGENLPEQFSTAVESDFPKCDFLIIIGTSLAVAPFNMLISRVNKNCPRLLINMEPVGNSFSFWDPFGSKLMFDSPKNHRDIFHKSACDDGVVELAKLMGWERDFRNLLQKEMKLNPTQTLSSGGNLTRATARAASSKVTITPTGMNSLSSKTTDKTTRTDSTSPTKSVSTTRRNASPTKATGASTRKPTNSTTIKKTNTPNSSKH